MALELKDVTLRQGAFDLRADLAVEAKKRVAIIGPSGAGKSTLLSLIAGFVAPDAGQILWGGADITLLRPAKRPVAMLFQDGNLFPHLTVWQNAALGVHPGLKLSDDDKARVGEGLARVGLVGMEGRKPAELSGGQQSRAALARVLLQDKPLILLDEPFAALGPALRADMLALVSEIAEQMRATVLMVSHAPEDAKRFADEVIFVDGGVAQPPVATQRLFEAPSEALGAYLGSA